MCRHLFWNFDNFKLYYDHIHVESCEAPRLYPHESYDPSTSEGNYGESVRPSHIVSWYGQHQYHQYPHMNAERPPQEQYISHYTQNIYPGHVYCPQQQCINVTSRESYTAK